MNEIKIFENPEFGEIRTIRDGEKVMFCGSDVAKALGYGSNPQDAIRRHCREDGCVNHAVIDKLGRMQEARFIDEGNLYRLIAHSKLPSAQRFEQWVFDEVLPSIRKTGGYISGQETLSDDELLERALLVAKRRIEERDKVIARQREKIEADRPKTIFADAVSVSRTSILIGELAKIIKQNGVDIGQNRLFEWMRKNEYLISRNGADYNMPTQKSMNLKLFEIKERTINNPDGSIRITKTVLVTGKGQLYFVNKFLGKEEVNN